MVFQLLELGREKLRHRSREKVAILDAGAQYGKLIDRYVREHSVYSDVLPLNTPARKLKKYDAIIITGGPESVYGKDAPHFDPKVLDLNIPILGICYGMQLLNQTAHGTVGKEAIREDGQFSIEVDPDSQLFTGLDIEQRVLLTHGDSVGKVAEGYRVIAKSSNHVVGIECPEKKRWGIQFHPESRELTENGMAMFGNFLHEIAGFSGDYPMDDRIESSIRYLRRKVGKRRDLLNLLSGGVDSSVLGALSKRAVGERATSLHVDHGFLRKGESRKVKRDLGRAGFPLIVIDAADRFYTATTTIDGQVVGPLSEVTDPEHKRKIIGDTFMAVAEEEIRKLGLDPRKVIRGQGSLRPDAIESAYRGVSSVADLIKSHHNFTQATQALRKRGLMVEPLIDYHKDEVRELGLQLGLPEELVWRHPFPGPGLAIRILCAREPYITPDFYAISKALRGFNTESISATLVPVRTVGVQGDGRSYNYLAALSGTADWGTLFKLAHEIPQAIHSVNRVAYIFGDKLDGPQTSITPTLLSPEVVGQLQEADDIVTHELIRHDLLRSINQFPVISFPANFGIEGHRSIALRPFITDTFMTGRPAVPGEDMPADALDAMVSRILREVPGVSRVALDLSTKPPGTTEWE